MFRKSLTVFIVAGLLATFSLLASALFTSSATVSNNTFTTGTLDLTAAPTSSALTISNMAPGDSVTAPITLTNAGTLQLRYALTSTSTNTDNKNLAAQMTLQIKSGVTTCNASGFGVDGTSVYSGTLASALFGDPTQGAQAGDRVLNPSASELLCFQAGLPLSSGNAYQGATTTSTLTFSAEQTANNP